jgi:hypothetical protein
MRILDEPLMISTAPDHIVLGLGVFFAFAAVSLLCLAIEKGIYQDVPARFGEAFDRFVRQRQRKQRWAYYAFGGEHGVVAAYS